MTKKLPPTTNAQPLRAILRGGAGVVVLVLAGCSAPAVEGYQVQDPPEGFLYAANQTPGGGVLAPREVVSQGTWFGDIKDEPHSTLEVTRYRGGATQAEAAAARDARVARVGASQYNLIGPLRTRALPDSGTAWSWTEERHDEYGRFNSMQVSEVLSFDTVSFSLVFDTSVPERMTEAHLDGVLATFALGRTIIHWRLIWGSAGVLAILVALLLRRSRRLAPKAYRLWEAEEKPKSPRPPDPGDTDPGEPGPGESGSPT
jgi:hypothetical protein